MARKRNVASLALVSTMMLSSAGILGQPDFLSGNVQAWNDGAVDENITEDIILDEETDFDTEDVDTNAAVRINATNFPDSVFRAYVKKFDTNNNGILNDAELAKATAIAVSDKGIETLDGIEFFTSLKSLSCTGNDLSSLDVSNNTALENLYCSTNPIRSLDLSKNTKLKNLDCSLCELSRLDLSKNLSLVKLVSRSNKFSTLDLSSHKSLKEVDVSINYYLKTIDLTNCSALTTLTAFETFPTDGYSYSYCTVTLKGCSKVTNINLSDSHIGKLDVSSCTALQYLNVGYTDLEALDVSKNVNIKEIRCERNPIDTLNLTKNTKLEVLDCCGCDIDTLNLGKCTALRELNCVNNGITKLNLAANKNLKYLYCAKNELTSLDVSKNTNLVVLSCPYNSISSLNVNSNPKLEVISCYGNDISSLNITKVRSVASAVKAAKQQKASDHYFYELDGNGDYGIYGLYYDFDTKIVTPSKLPSPTPKPGTPTPKKSTPTPKKGNPTKAPVFSDFVERLYICALNRKSDAGGKKYWTEEVTSGRRTGGDCARYFLLDAPEFMNRKLSTDAFVETLYKTFFDRKSDAAGKKGWVDAINSKKMTRAQVVENFIESTEWCNICAKYGVKSGAKYHKATVPSANAKAFATRLYTACLGRSAEAAGLKYWALALTNLEKTGCDAAREFFTSQEFVNLKTTNEEYVRRLYKTFMGRTPASDEVTYWAGQIKSGKMTRRAVLVFFGSCDEFTAICAKYGINRGNI